MSIQIKRGTSSKRTASNETLKAGQPFYETDSGKLYIGNDNDKLRDLKNNFAMLNDNNLFVGDQAFDNEDHTSYIGLKLNNECSLAVGIDEDIKLNGSKREISIGNDLSITSKNIQMYLPTGIPMLNIEPSNTSLELGSLSTSTPGIKINTDGFDVYKDLGVHTRYGLNSIDKYFLDSTGSIQKTLSYFLPSGSGVLALQSDITNANCNTIKANTITAQSTSAGLKLACTQTSGTENCSLTLKGSDKRLIFSSNGKNLALDASTGYIITDFSGLSKGSCLATFPDDASKSGILLTDKDLPTYYIHNVFLTYSQPNVSTQTLTKARVAISVINTSDTAISTVTDLVNSITNKAIQYYRCSGYYKIGSATAVEVQWMQINKNPTNNITLMDADMSSSTKLLLDNGFITLSGQDYVTQIL